jgi:hypothetical protein
MNDDWERTDRLAEADKYLNRAYELESRNEQADALLDCRHAVEVGRAFLAEAYNLQGIVLEGLGRQQEALEAYQAAVELLPGFDHAADNLRNLQAEMGLTENIVTLVRFSTGWEAQIARGQLQANGIPAFVADESAVTALGGSFGIRLQVRASDLDRAREILDLPEEDATLDEILDFPEEDVIVDQGLDLPGAEAAGRQSLDRPETDGVQRPAFCTHCGQPLGPGDRICPSCGLDICPDCGTSLRHDEQVCSSCGAHFSFACPRCGQELSFGVDACPHCGTEFEYDETA